MAKICVLGGSGFIGRHLCERLAQEGHQLLVPTRRRERAKHLITLPTIDVVDADVHGENVLSGLFQGADAVINLIGVLHSRRGKPYGPQFAKAHVELPRRIVAACIAAKVPRLLHVSALKAAPDAPSAYLRSKGEGEAVVVEARGRLAATIFRPSVVFGPEDSFLNRFAQLQSRMPVLPLVCPQAQFQPVYVGDVAEVMTRSLWHEESFGRAYDLAGPRVYSLRELVACAGKWSGHPRPIIGLGDKSSYFMSRLMEFAPGKPLTADQYWSMRLPSTSSSPLPFGLAATPLETVAPVYLSGIYPRSRYSLFRHYAGRKRREV